MNLLAIIFPLLAVAGGCIALAFINNSKSKSKSKLTTGSKKTVRGSRNKTQEELTAQEFVNIKDVTDKYLHTRDGNIFM